MKFLVVVAVIVALAQCNPFGLSKKDNLKCPVCEMLVQDSELWLGKEGQKDEGAAVNVCLKETSRIGLGRDESAEMCDVIVKDMLDTLIEEMESKDYTADEAHALCVKTGYCKH